MVYQLDNDPFVNQKRLRAERADEIRADSHRFETEHIMRIQNLLADTAILRFDHIKELEYRQYQSCELSHNTNPHEFIDWIRHTANEKQRTLLDPIIISGALSAISSWGFDGRIDHHLATVLQLLLQRDDHDITSDEVGLVINDQRLMIRALTK